MKAWLASIFLFAAVFDHGPAHGQAAPGCELQVWPTIEVVEIDARIATAAADIRFRSRMKLMDAYILATAQVNGAILITRNIKDFRPTCLASASPTSFEGSPHACAASSASSAGSRSRSGCSMV